jgi:hypothetical protein
LPPDLRLLVDTAEKLRPKNRRLAIRLIKALKEQAEESRGVEADPLSDDRLLENLTTIELHSKVILLRRLCNEKIDFNVYFYDDYFYCFWAGKK